MVMAQQTNENIYYYILTMAHNLRHGLQARPKQENTVY